ELAALLTERRTPLRGYFGYALLYWLLVGVGYYCVLAAFDPTVEVRTAVLVTGFYAGAWLAGYYTLLSPGGLGIRELTYAALLLTVLPSPLAAMLPLVARLWTLVGELISGLIAVALLRTLRTE
ncbi:MAG: flippase-like domain-containing protein, partial [Chloroflexi bacterium]|nr:flippase-like domain-containing protein [Chloroflexota bacterium]